MLRAGQPEAGMLIAILSSSEVADWYSATLMERGHTVVFVDGHVPTIIDTLIRKEVGGILILSDDDPYYDEIAARFARATGKPVWHNLTEIPRGT
jgi:hypothetical protein